MFYFSRVELMRIAPLRFHVFYVFIIIISVHDIHHIFHVKKTMAEKGCLLWEVEENCNCAKEHKNSQTIIIIIIIIYLDNILKRGKRGLQSRSTKSHKRFACMITQTDYEFTTQFHWSVFFVFVRFKINSVLISLQTQLIDIRFDLE